MILMAMLLLVVAAAAAAVAAAAAAVVVQVMALRNVDLERATTTPDAMYRESVPLTPGMLPPPAATI